MEISISQSKENDSKPKVILAFLQNQWFKDPDKVKAIYERHPDKRNYFIREFLFLRCLTGKRIRAAFGSDMCSRIIWEDASMEIGNFSASKFKADLQHIKNAIEKFKPDAVVCFGKVAVDAVKTAADQLIEQEKISDLNIFNCPHPAARYNTKPELEAVAEKLKNL